MSGGCFCSFEIYMHWKISGGCFCSFEQWWRACRLAAVAESLRKRWWTDSGLGWLKMQLSRISCIQSSLVTTGSGKTSGQRSFKEHVHHQSPVISHRGLQHSFSHLQEAQEGDELQVQYKVAGKLEAWSVIAIACTAGDNLSSLHRGFPRLASMPPANTQFLGGIYSWLVEVHVFWVCGVLLFLGSVEVLRYCCSTVHSKLCLFWPDHEAHPFVVIPIPQKIRIAKSPMTTHIHNKIVLMEM